MGMSQGSVQKKNLISMGYIAFNEDIQLPLNCYCVCMP